MYPDECARTVGLSIISPTGEFFLAIGFLILSVSTAIFLMMGRKQQPEKRPFFIITSSLTLVAALCYFSMLSGQGWVISPNCRQVFYSYYICSAISSVLVILDLALIAGVEMDLLLSVIGYDLMCMFCVWAASVSQGNVKWMWFLFAGGAAAPVVIAILQTFRRSADLHHVSVSELYNKVSFLILVVWAFYPLIWLIGTGGNLMSPNFEMMCLTTLDILSSSVFGFVLLMSHEALDRAANVYGYKFVAAAGGGGGNVASYGNNNNNIGNGNNNGGFINNNNNEGRVESIAKPKSSTVVMT